LFSFFATFLVPFFSTLGAGAEKFFVGFLGILMVLNDASARTRAPPAVLQV